MGIPVEKLIRKKRKLPGEKEDDVCDNSPLADPHYLNLSWPSDRQVVSLISGQGYFIFLYRHTKHNIHNWKSGGKENKQTRSWVRSKHKKGEVCDTFLAFCESVE